MIKHRVAIFIVNPKDSMYHRGHSKRTVDKFLSSIKQPHVVKYICTKNIYKVSMNQLGTLSYDLNIVVLPSRAFYWDIKIHSKAIVLTVSLAAGNPKYSHGIYVNALSLISKYLGGCKVSLAKGSLYARLKPEGKAIIIASMVDVVDPTVFSTLYRKVCKLKLDSAHRDVILNILRRKKFKYKLDIGAHS